MCLPVACLTTGPSMARPVLLYSHLAPGAWSSGSFVQRVAEQIGFGADARIVVNAARHAEQLPDGHVAFAFGTNVRQDFSHLGVQFQLAAGNRQPRRRAGERLGRGVHGIPAFGRGVVKVPFADESAAAHHQTRLRTVPLQPVSHLVQPCPGHSVAIGPGGFPFGNRPCGLSLREVRQARGAYGPRGGQRKEQTARNHGERPFSPPAHAFCRTQRAGRINLNARSLDCKLGRRNARTPKKNAPGGRSRQGAKVLKTENPKETALAILLATSRLGAVGRGLLLGLAAARLAFVAASGAFQAARLRGGTATFILRTTLTPLLAAAELFRGRATSARLGRATSQLGLAAILLRGGGGQAKSQAE